MPLQKLEFTQYELNFIKSTFEEAYENENIHSVKEYVVNICQKELNRNVSYKVLQVRYDSMLKDNFKRSASNHDDIQSKKRIISDTLFSNKINKR